MNRTLVCLHGWGGSKESFTELREALKDTPITILTPDLPGFGEEPEPKKPWTTDHYAGWTAGYIQHNVKGPFMLLGHSHGGRIAIKLAAMQELQIERLFLCAAAGIRHPRHFKRIIGLTLAKSGKALLTVPGLKSLQPIAKKLLYKLVRVHDYERATPIMRQTLINVSKEDLRPLLRTITIPTDLFWGKDDGMTPFSDALIMEREIPHAALHSFEGVRHRVHRDKAEEIASEIKSRMDIA
ncbi:MAG: alpha/beta hydrolase [Candidatus Peribacteraceae bacterium]|nr:alpha/beta hydrolase [Candidatus Peribacteraceae bacterium]